MADFQWDQLGFLMLACCITTLPGLLGFIFPRKCVKKYMGIFLSVGIGALLATVFLHIVPEMMEASQDEFANKALEHYREFTLKGTHDPNHQCGHSHSGHGHWHPQVTGHGVSNPPPAEHHHCDHAGNMYTGLAFIIGIMIAFIMETFLHNHDHGSCADHDHRHSISCHTLEHVHTADCGHSAIEMPGQIDATKSSQNSEKPDQSQADSDTGKAVFTTTVIFMLAAQMLHHFCDGVLLGSLFANNKKAVRAKMVTTLAFFAHEFGQSISGYAVYINEGWSTASAVGLVMLGYAPMYISSASIFAVAATSQSVQRFFTLYCPPLAVGFFLFIVLADMVPDVVHYHKDTKWQNALAVVLSLGLVAAIVILIPHEH